MWSGDGQTGWGFGQRSDGVSRYYFFGMMELGYRYAVDLRTMVDGTIYNFVGTRTISGTQQILKGYVNGALVGSVTNNTIFNLSTSTYFPGYNPTVLRPQQYYAGGANPPPATLHNIKVYNRDLSAKEIIQNYQSMLPRFVGENIITDGLILYLDAGYKSSYGGSGTTWYDVSGYGNNGTLTNSPTYNSSNNGSIVFDGVDDYISIVGVNSLFEVANATFTVNMWVYAYAIQNRMGLWGKNDAYEFGFISSGSIQFWSPGGTFSVAIVDSNYLNQWKMITSINSPQGSYVYSNGVLIGYGGQLSGVGGSNFAIGSGFDPPGTNTFNGRIGITQIYNRALTETEISQNYNAQKGRYGL
jgi:hypothetical protein